MPFKSKYAEKTYLAMIWEATKKALDDCRLSATDIDGVVYAVFSEPMLRQQIPDIRICEYLGMGGKPGLRVCSAGATGGHGISAAYMQVASGLSDIVLLVAVQKGSDFYDFKTRSRGDALIKGASISADVTWERPIMPGGVSGLLTVLCWLPHMEKYGGPTLEQAAKVSVKNHRNALANPNAQLKVELTVEEVINSRVIAWPTTLYQCGLYSDGAAAMVLASEEKAKAITDTPIWIKGVGVSDYSMHRLEPDLLGRLPGVAQASKKAYQMAGIKNPREELDVIELHDLISSLEIITYEELGLCPPGEGGRLVDDGTVEKSGPLPVNPSGGCVACGNVEGVSGVSSACDVVLQLREKAGNMQVPVPKGRGLVESICGAGSFSTVTVLEREG